MRNRKALKCTERREEFEDKRFEFLLSTGWSTGYTKKASAIYKLQASDYGVYSGLSEAK